MSNSEPLYLTTPNSTWCKTTLYFANYPIKRLTIIHFSCATLEHLFMRIGITTRLKADSSTLNDSSHSKND